MKKSILIAVVAVVIVVLIAGIYLGYNAMLNSPSATPTPTPSPTSGVATQQTVRDSTMMYIATNHADISSLTENLIWAGGRQETGLVGSETYIYNAGNWNVTITNPVVLNPIYTINAVYIDIANQVSIQWQGTYQNNTITETSLNYTVP